jgi:hypothetical protein
MRFRQLALCCECGLIPTRIRQVGLSTQHQLVIHWWCMGCRKSMFVVKDLTECWEECPKPEEAGVTAVAAEDMESCQADVRFLQSLGIRFPGEADRR